MSGMNIGQISIYSILSTHSPGLKTRIRHSAGNRNVRAALEQAFAHNGPALVDIAVNRQELAMPPSLKLDQIVDFNLYMIKAILNGRGDEIVDLARTNLSQ
jgi:hypothetical protein